MRLKMNNYNLCISLNQHEKALVTDLARSQNKKPTEYVKGLLLALAPDDSKPTIYIPMHKLNYEIGSKQKCVKAYFTDNEFKAIEHMANNEPLSRFVARRALQGEHVLNIEVNDDDFTFVYSIIEPLYTSIYMYLNNLKSINAIEPDVIDSFLTEIKEANTHLIQLTEHFKKNRHSLRKSRLNELRKLSSFLIKDYELLSVEQ